MNNVVRQKLAELVARFGRDLGNDPARCEGLLRDVCGSHRAEIFVLSAAARDGVPGDLLNSSASVPKQLLLVRLTKRLHEHSALEEEIARWGVESWALALGVISAAETNAPAGRHNPLPGGRDPLVVDVLAEFPHASAEDILRQKLYRVLADGIVTPAERAEVNQLCRELGIDSETAGRIVGEITRELGIAHQGTGTPSRRWLPFSLARITSLLRWLASYPVAWLDTPSIATWAVWAGAASVISVPLCCPSPLLGGAAVGLAFLANARIRKGRIPAAAKQKVIAAWTLGGVGLTIGILITVAATVMFATRR